MKEGRTRPGQASSPLTSAPSAGRQGTWEVTSGFHSLGFCDVRGPGIGKHVALLPDKAPDKSVASACINATRKPGQRGN